MRVLLVHFIPTICAIKRKAQICESIQAITIKKTPTHIHRASKPCTTATTTTITEIKIIYCVFSFGLASADYWAPFKLVLFNSFKSHGIETVNGIQWFCKNDNLLNQYFAFLLVFEKSHVNNINYFLCVWVWRTSEWKRAFIWVNSIFYTHVGAQIHAYKFKHENILMKSTTIANNNNKNNRTKKNFKHFPMM